MATTTNYGWTTPDDTALVKDGASAIRSLGTSVDTTTKNLNPSTTLGDIEYRSSTANTNTRLGIGSTGNVLTVAGGVPTWAAPASTTPAFVGCSLYKSTTTSSSSSAYVTLSWDSERFDTDAFHSTSTNTSRITIPSGKAGKYRVGYTGMWSGNSVGQRQTYIMKNGTLYGDHKAFQSAVGEPTSFQNTIIMNLIVGDYIELETYQSSGSTLTIDATEKFGFFEIEYLGA
jgi:hypothetical protein